MGIIGSKHSEETKRKMSEWRKGRPKSEAHKRATSQAMKKYYRTHPPNLGMLGKKHSEETRRKMVASAHRGEKHRYWKGGKSQELEEGRIRQSPKYVRWAKAIKERDLWACQSCGQVGGTIVAHHILSFYTYPELRFVLNNGVTLCRGCHTRLHNIQVLSKVI